MECFDLAPTAYEELRAREAALSVRQQRARARRVLRRLLDSGCDSDLWRKWSAATQHQALCRVACYCNQEGIECPLWVRVLLVVYADAQQVTDEGAAEQLDIAPPPGSDAGVSGAKSV